MPKKVLLAKFKDHKDYLFQAMMTFLGEECHRLLLEQYSQSELLLASSLILSGGNNTNLWVSVHILGHSFGIQYREHLLLKEFRAKGNTSDFILEHFIVLFLDGTQWAPTMWNLGSTVMAIQLCTLRVTKTLQKTCNN